MWLYVIITPPCIALNPNGPHGLENHNHFWKESPYIHRATPIWPQRVVPSTCQKAEARTTEMLWDFMKDRTCLWVLDILWYSYRYAENVSKLLIIFLGPKTWHRKVPRRLHPDPMKWLEPSIAAQVQVREVFRLQNGKASCLRCQQHREVVWSSIHFERWVDKLLPSLTSWLTFCWSCSLWDAF